MEMPTFNTLATSYCSEESTKTYVVMRESGAFWPIRVQLGGESLKKQKWEYTITNGITGVIISFIMGNWDEPVVIGSLWNKQSPIPADWPNEKNIYKTIKTNT